MKYEIEIDGRLVAMDDNKDYYVNKDGEWLSYNRNLNEVSSEFWLFDDDVEELVTEECVDRLYKCGADWAANIMIGPGRFANKGKRLYKMLGE